MKKSLLKYTVISSIFALLIYLSLEPQVSLSQVSDQFIVTQTISAEIAIKTAASNVALSPAIAGITGGTSTGNTSIVILTNNDTGYTMTIVASNSPAMRGNVSNSTALGDYAAASAYIPDYTFTNTGAKLGYSVSAASTTDVAQKFLDNGASCNTGSSDTGGSNSCWYGLSTTATSVVVRNTISPLTGATTTLYFKVYVASNSFIPEDIYTATSTLTATLN